MKVLSDYIFKLMWASFNFLNSYFKFVNLSDISPFYCVIDESVICDSNKILVLLIDYEGFKNRTEKVLTSSISYTCGREGLESLKDELIVRNYDYLDLITVDNGNCLEPRLNCTCYVKNNGTDIALLDSVSDIIKKYENVFVVNSSSSVEDMKTVNFDLINSIISKSKGDEFVIGFNGNSKISPRLPLTRNIYPHIITNSFVCKSKTLLRQLDYANEKKKERNLLKFCFSNKYFCISFFEIGLSVGVTQRGGGLYLLSEGADDKYGYLKYSDLWPREDSRLSKYENQ